MSTVSGYNKRDKPGAHRAFFYGWVIVAVCTLLQATQYGIQYSFGIFFKPIIADFGWSRAEVSGVFSLYQIAGGLFAVPIGWLADKYGPAKVSTFCGFAVGLGLVLTSQIKELWQLYLTFGVIEGLGASGAFSISNGVAARWFVKRRGFALGIVSTGVGLGTLVMSPLAERLITIIGWARTYTVIGVIAGAVMIISSLFLRRDPAKMGWQPYGAEAQARDGNEVVSAGRAAPDSDLSLSEALRTKLMWITVSIFFLFNFGVQLVLLHLVNYATDLGITPLIAATVVSVIGIGSVFGRLGLGTLSDRIGNINVLVICCLAEIASLIWLIFANQAWMFYVFAIVFSLAYGGEVPQMTLLTGKFFGMRALSSLVGVTVLVARLGGALSGWIAGQIFDVTQSYQIAFVVAVCAGILALVFVALLRRPRPKAGGLP